MPIDRHAIITAARRYLGTPFQHQGRFLVFPEGGCSGGDCIGLILRVGWDVGIPLEDWRGYGRSTDGMRLTAECTRQLVAIHADAAQPGDVVQWADARSPTSPPCNVAIVGDRGTGRTLIHARVMDMAAGTGVVVEHGYRGVCLRGTRYAYQFPEVLPWFPLVQGG